MADAPTRGRRFSRPEKAGALAALGLAPGPSSLKVKVRRIEGNEALATEGLHTNDFFLILYMEAGSGLVRLGADEREAAAGDILALAPGQVYDFSGLVENCRGSAVAFRTEAVTDAARSALPLPGDPRWVAFVRQACLMGGHYSLDPDSRSIWEGHVAELEEELAVQSAGFEQAVRALLSLILVDMARVALPPLGEPSAVIDPVLADVWQLIDARFPEPLLLDDIAREVARSPSQLTRVVRQLTGETVMHWLDERRMVEARHLLLETDETVELIADQVGYGDIRHFRRRFRRAHGMPPQTWRQLNR